MLSFSYAGLSIAPFPMVRLVNPGVLCWHNASVFAVLHLLKACGITIPVEAFETGRETYMSHFGQWSHLATSELRNPWFSLELFVREFMPDEVTVSEIRNNTQGAHLFFEALAGQNRFGSNGVELFSFMRPITLTRVAVETCMDCGRETGESSQDYNYVLKKLN